MCGGGSFGPSCEVLWINAGRYSNRYSVQVTCDDRLLRKQLADSARALRELGKVRAKRLASRVADLQALATLADGEHIPGRLHPLVGDRDGQFSLDLDHPYRLLFVPDHDPLPELLTGGLDRAAVTQVRLIGIVDTHD